ncbi:hypothetical protein A6R68_22728 [Neotoma lepida]|uniref:Uncharacterized protein n=1 Tax=Neotoma lepida TaxID=56216 RepID=A0A1A6HZ66_NEOLE|nr:hypothetical protein A6R68_22728 [Neotoma lepida]
MDIKGLHINNSDVSLQVLTLRIGNHPGVLNPSPSVETVQVHFICAHPASMLVTPVYKVAAGTQPCPLPQYNKQLTTKCSKQKPCPEPSGGEEEREEKEKAHTPYVNNCWASLRDSVLELAVFDQHGRKFDNFSSLILEWKSSNETLAYFDDAKPMEMVAKNDGSGQTQLHGTVKSLQM